MHIVDKLLKMQHAKEEAEQVLIENLEQEAEPLVEGFVVQPSTISLDGKKQTTSPMQQRKVHVDKKGKSVAAVLSSYINILELSCCSSARYPKEKEL